MKVTVDNIVTINPSIVRVNVYTHTEATDYNDFKRYEFAIPITDFTENDGKGNIAIDGDVFQRVVSQKILDARIAANLAVYMNNLTLEWELITDEQPQSTEEETAVEGKTLAYGGDIT